MTKTLLLLLVSFMPIFSYAQTDKIQNEITTAQRSNPVAFRLFPTQNMWTYIKLNTRTGQMWQVQFSMKSETRFVTNLSSVVLASKEDEVNDRFTLYPSQNMYTFILLDQFDGRTWQVQWATEVEKRAIISIE